MVPILNVGLGIIDQIACLNKQTNKQTSNIFIRARHRVCKVPVPVLCGVELCEVIQLVLRLREAQHAAVRLRATLLQLVHDGSVEGIGPLPHDVAPRRLAKPEAGVHRQLGRLVGLNSEVADVSAVR